MVNPTPSRPNVLRTRKLRAEKALRAARYQLLRARTQLIGSTGAAAVARRVVVELAQRELDQAIAEVAAAAEALDADDARQMPLAAWSRPAPPRPDGARTGGASAAESSEPLLAWGRTHGLGAH
jgi:hypothetical protein